MTTIKWKDSPEAAVRSGTSHTSAKADKGNASAVKRSDPWFGIAMGLIGLIVGYFLAVLFRYI